MKEDKNIVTEEKLANMLKRRIELGYDKVTYYSGKEVKVGDRIEFGILVDSPTKLKIEKIKSDFFKPRKAENRKKTGFLQKINLFLPEQNLEIISYSSEEIGTVYELIDRKNSLPNLKLIE